MVLGYIATACFPCNQTDSWEQLNYTLLAIYKIQPIKWA